jgi:hypothetical protein
MSLPIRGTLGAGDRLESVAELEVSTTCLEPSRRCVGRRYGFSPRVTARLVLANGDSPRGVAISRPHSIRCSQELPNRNHHCVLVVSGRDLLVRDPRELECQPATSPPTCAVNLVVEARHPEARSNQKLVIGVDSPRGIQGDRGRIYAAIHDPGWAGLPAPRPDTARTRRARVGSLPVGRRGSGGRRQVIASLQLKGHEITDEFIVDASMRLGLGGLPYNALVRSELVLARRPGAVKSPGTVKEFAEGAGDHINESNGFNCTHGRSAHTSPCRVQKHAYFRISQASGRRKPKLYVNLVASTAAVYGGRYRSEDRAAVPSARISYERYRGIQCLHPVSPVWCP